MASILYSQQDEFDLTNSDQDCRGWIVRDAAGKQLGKVTDLVIDTEAEHVDSIVLDSGAQIRAADFALRNGTVLVSGGGAGAATTTTASRETRATAPAAAAARPAAGKATDEGEVALPVIEERIRVGKRQVERGGVRVQQHVTERPVEETVTLREEHVNVERRPVDRPLGSAIGPDAFKEGVIEVTETAEEAVVSKQARVVEEVVIGKDVTERQETVRDTVRRTDVDVEQVDANTAKDTNRRAK